MRLALLFFIFPFLIHSQEDKNRQVSFVGGINRLDYLSGLQYYKKTNTVGIIGSFELGIQRTFIQTRFFPRFGFGVDYPLLNKDKFSLGPYISYYYSALKVKSNSSHLHKWEEILLGYRLKWGSKIRFTHQVAGGLMVEHYFNQLSGKKDGVGSIGFYVNIGVAYVW